MTNHVAEIIIDMLSTINRRAYFLPILSYSWFHNKTTHGHMYNSNLSLVDWNSYERMQIFERSIFIFADVLPLHYIKF